MFQGEEYEDKPRKKRAGLLLLSEEMVELQGSLVRSRDQGDHLPVVKHWNCDCVAQDQKSQEDYGSGRRAEYQRRPDRGAPRPDLWLR